MTYHPLNPNNIITIWSWIEILLSLIIIFITLKKNDKFIICTCNPNKTLVVLSLSLPIYWIDDSSNLGLCSIKSTCLNLFNKKCFETLPIPAPQSN